MTSVAIVGSGLAGFTAYATLRRAGIEDVTVFGLDDDPAAVWRTRAAAIRQREMRSESAGHCLPTTFPGLALQAAARRRSVRPLAQTLCDRFHPTVDEFLAHVEQLRARTRWDDALVRARVERVRAVRGGFEVHGSSRASNNLLLGVEPARPALGGFEVHGSPGASNNLLLGTFRHLLVAPGHPGLHVPDELRGDARVVHAYEPHEYAGTVTVVGAGLAAATEWLNALAAGAEVVSVRRREPVRRPLNVPRPYLSRRELAPFHRLGDEERASRLRALLVPSYPPGRVWDEPLARAAAEGRFRVEQSVNGSAQVICATGFRRGWQHDALLRRLVDEHGLRTLDAWIALDGDSSVPALTDATRTLALAGVPAQWAFPAADTLMGARYAAHGFLRRIRSCRTR